MSTLLAALLNVLRAGLLSGSALALENAALRKQLAIRQRARLLPCHHRDLPPRVDLAGGGGGGVPEQRGGACGVRAVDKVVHEIDNPPDVICRAP